MSDNTWLNRINNDRKGIWGVKYPQGSSRLAADDLECNTTDCEVAVIYVVQINGRCQLRYGEDAKDYHLESIVNVLVAEALSLSRKFLRLVIADFHVADIADKCELVKTARAIQETNIDITIQTVFCGNWSFYSFKSGFHLLHGKTNSPAAEYKNIIYAPKQAVSELKIRLLEAKLISMVPTELDQIACEFLIEQTAGDDFLIDTFIDHLQSRSDGLILNVEKILKELIECHDVINDIKCRVNSLDSESHEELIKLLRVHRLVRESDSVAIDCLWAAGLVTRSPLDGNKNSVELAGPVISAVIRNLSASLGIQGVATPDGLCFDRHVISAAAFRKVAEIENLLRNLAGKRPIIHAYPA